MTVDSCRMSPHDKPDQAAPDYTRQTSHWTPQRIRALGPVTDVVTAGAILGLSRSVAYDLVVNDF